MGKPIKIDGKEYGYKYWLYLSNDIDSYIINELEKSKNQSSEIRSALRIKYGTLNKTVEGTSYWERKQVDKTHNHYICHKCRHESKYKKTPYCPYCGLPMENGGICYNRKR